MEKIKTFPPLLLLALGGSKEFISNSSLLVKMVYSSRLARNLDEHNLMVVFDLVAVVAIVLEEEMESEKEMLSNVIASEIR